LHAISIDPPIGFGFSVIQPGFNGRGELYPFVVGSDNCQCNFLIAIIKYATLVFPDVIRGNVVKGAFGYLQHVRALKEECILKFMIMRPRMVCYVGPPLFKDYFSDVPGSGTVKCHVVDVFFLIAVGAFSACLFAPHSSSYWECVAAHKFNFSKLLPNN
jgi:hypothetical protein